MSNSDVAFKTAVISLFIAIMLFIAVHFFSAFDVSVSAQQADQSFGTSRKVDIQKVKLLISNDKLSGKEALFYEKNKVVDEKGAQ